MKRATFCLTSLATLLALSGCGSGSSPAELAPGDSAQGRATLTILWPERSETSRLIPLSTNSIKVVVQDSTGAVRAEQLIARPSNGTSSTINFPALPVGTLTVVATAYPNTNGSGTAQAMGSGPLVITASANTSIGITLASTIKTVELSYTPRPLRVNQTVTLSLSAKDAAGNIVLTSPSKWQFTSSNTLIARILAGGMQLQGLALGSVTITATEKESNVSVSTPINVVTNTDYLTIALKPFASFTQVFPFAVNNKGWIAGQLIVDNDNRTVFLWKLKADLSGGDYTLLAPLPNHKIGHPISVSDSGVILLSAINTQTNQGVYWLWENGSYRSIPAPMVYVNKMSTNGILAGYDINFRSILVGLDGSVVSLPDQSTASSVHPGGFVTGSVPIQGESNARPWRYKDGISSYTNPTAPFTDARGVGVNSSGEVCLAMYNWENSLQGAGYWDGGPSIVVLQVPSGYEYPYLVGIADDGTIGGSASQSGSRAIVWRNKLPVFLDTLVPPGSPRLDIVQAISPNGHMALNGSDGTNFISVLLIPSSLL